MTAKENMQEVFRSQGRADALALRSEADTLTGTQIIDRERCVPVFDPDKDYSEWPVGAPVSDEGQVWTLIIPHNAADYQARPSTNRACWGLCHTTDPKKAKHWVDPYGTSGMYMTGECYRDSAGKVHRCNRDNVVYDADTMPDYWKDVEVSA